MNSPACQKNLDFGHVAEAANQHRATIRDRQGGGGFPNRQVGHFDGIGNGSRYPADDGIVRIGDGVRSPRDHARSRDVIGEKTNR